ncbi:hypothetical protein CALVIDRAFT_542174 [Calocera viscosa TUFC12733]|uniref:Uncharacterized protein n=1 Tax=Calocera viscosa (strain TUFC12733) TaxID=1330018 RepID=A0A167GXH2_CALVF|nr:hypothetical protein CALVIDRAFT_542174 [Calocera viscosa TUFC12733]
MPDANTGTPRGFHPPGKCLPYISSAPGSGGWAREARLPLSSHVLASLLLTRNVDHAQRRWACVTP